MNDYRVVLRSDGIYAVEQRVLVSDYEDRWNIVFRGSLADCEAYIRLKKGGYL